jgi:hypothetical protein
LMCPHKFFASLKHAWGSRTQPLPDRKAQD